MCPSHISIHMASSEEVGRASRVNSRVSEGWDEPEDAGKFNLTLRSHRVGHEDFQKSDDLQCLNQREQ